MPTRRSAPAPARRPAHVGRNTSDPPRSRPAPACGTRCAHGPVGLSRQERIVDAHAIDCTTAFTPVWRAPGRSCGGALRRRHARCSACQVLAPSGSPCAHRKAVLWEAARAGAPQQRGRGSTLATIDAAEIAGTRRITLDHVPAPGIAQHRHRRLPSTQHAAAVSRGADLRPHGCIASSVACRMFKPVDLVHTGLGHADAQRLGADLVVQAARRRHAATSCLRIAPGRGSAAGRPGSPQPPPPGRPAGRGRLRPHRPEGRASAQGSAQLLRPPPARGLARSHRWRSGRCRACSRWCMSVKRAGQLLGARAAS